MDLKDRVVSEVMKLAAHPTVAPLLQDERVMKGVMQAFQLRGRLQDEFDEQVDRIAKSVGLATRREIRELKRPIRRMQGELDRSRNESPSETDAD